MSTCGWSGKIRLTNLWGRRGCTRGPRGWHERWSRGPVGSGRSGDCSARGPRLATVNPRHVLGTCVGLWWGPGGRWSGTAPGPPPPGRTGRPGCPPQSPGWAPPRCHSYPVVGGGSCCVCVMVAGLMKGGVRALCSLTGERRSASDYKYLWLTLITNLLHRYHPRLL